MRLDSFSLANDINLAHSTHTFLFHYYFSKLSFFTNFFLCYNSRMCCCHIVFDCGLFHFRRSPWEYI